MDKQTTAQPEAHISLNPAGYLEMVFHGVVYHATLQAMVEQATALAAEHGPINALIDGRLGAVDRKAKTFRVMMGMGRIDGVEKVVILTCNNPQIVHAIHGPSIVTSILSSTLGFKPIYIADESKARAMAAGN